MRFTLIDRITELKPNESITAIKALSLAEEYLHDHFPLFPVMPGVLMLEAACQTGAWLVRKSEDFAHSMVLLKEARNIKYADFVKPGQMLIVTCEILKQDESTTTLKFQGELDGKTGVSGRLVLERFNIADRTPTTGRRDKFMIEFQKSEFDLLYEPTES
jgi:3-hydroxyacyl-[acyl-carrier-protein] dehydratase